ncbi:MAG: hypothetical protein RJA13_713 [Bacteroidota bacterium]
MKKRILFAVLVLTSVSINAQTLNFSNEPNLGDSKQMFTCDPLTSNLSSVTGTGVTWDYTTIVGMNNAQQIVEVLDPATLPNASSFPSSTKALSVQNSITNYFSSTANERTSQGFVFEEVTLGTVVAKYDVNNQVVMQYPFGVNDYFSDVFSGSLDFSFNGAPQTPLCNGNSLATIDGQGTLLLPNATSISNVIRYKLTDTIFTQVDPGFGLLDIEFVRNQYEYYDLATGNLPVFIHTSVVVQQLGGTMPLLEQTVVVSSVEPTLQMSLAKLNEATFTIFPNPSEGTIHFSGDFSSDASARIFDNSGRKVATVESLNNGQSVDISFLNPGIYSVIVLNNGAQKTASIFVK